MTASRKPDLDWNGFGISDMEATPKPRLILLQDDKYISQREIQAERSQSLKYRCKFFTVTHSTQMPLKLSVLNLRPICRTLKLKSTQFAKLHMTQ
jgi:hypothetical protein